MIEVFTPLLEDTSKEDIEAICNIIQSTPELGFMYKALIIDNIKGNKDRCNLVYARLDGEIAGVAMIGSRRPYPYHFRTGDVAVPPKFRRHRIGTAMYFATTCAGILEGRRTVEETVILDLSPWMIREQKDHEAKCGLVKGGPGFLVSLGYHPVGQYPNWTGGFKTIEPWIKPTITEFDDWRCRVPSGTTIHLFDTPTSRKNYEDCNMNYLMHDRNLSMKLEALHSRLLSNRIDGVMVHVTKMGD